MPQSPGRFLGAGSPGRRDRLERAQRKGQQATSRSTARPTRKWLQSGMQRKIFWAAFTALGLLADLLLPFWWAVGATLPIGIFCWWLAYRSNLLN